MWNSLNSSAISIILVDESDLVGSLIDLAVTTVGLIFPLTDEVILYVERSIPIHRRYQLGISNLSLDNIISVLFDVSKSFPCSVYVLLWKYNIQFTVVLILLKRLTLIRVASQLTLKEWLVGFWIPTDVGLLIPNPHAFGIEKTAKMIDFESSVEVLWELR